MGTIGSLFDPDPFIASVLDDKILDKDLRIGKNPLSSGIITNGISQEASRPS